MLTVRTAGVSLLSRAQREAVEILAAVGVAAGETDTAVHDLDGIERPDLGRTHEAYTEPLRMESFGRLLGATERAQRSSGQHGPTAQLGVRLRRAVLSNLAPTIVALIISAGVLVATIVVVNSIV
jgi:hypothetical protein